MEDKSRRQLVVNPIHLGSNNGEECLGVNKHLDAILHNLLIKLAGLVDILEVVCQTGAAAVADANANHLGVGLVKQVAEMAHSSLRECDGGFSGL